MGVKQSRHPLDDRAHFGPVTVIIVHDDPLPVPQVGNLAAGAFQQRITVASKARDDTLAGPGADQIVERARPRRRWSDPVAH